MRLIEGVDTNYKAGYVELISILDLRPYKTLLLPSNSYVGIITEFVNLKVKRTEYIPINLIMQLINEGCEMVAIYGGEKHILIHSEGNNKVFRLYNDETYINENSVSVQYTSYCNEFELRPTNEIIRNK